MLQLIQFTPGFPFTRHSLFIALLPPPPPFPPPRDSPLPPPPPPLPPSPLFCVHTHQDEVCRSRPPASRNRRSPTGATGDTGPHVLDRPPPPPGLRSGAPRSRAVLVDPDVARQAEDPLAQDVLHDLGRAALDGVGPRPEERLERCRATWPCLGGGSSGSRLGNSIPSGPSRSTAHSVISLFSSAMASLPIDPRGRACPRPGLARPGCS